MQTQITESKDILTKQIAKGASVLFLGIILVNIINYFSKVLLARGLGAETFGLFALSFAILNTISILSFLGIPNAMRRHISFFDGKKDQEAIKNTIIWGLLLSVGIGIIIGVLFFLSAEYLALFFKNANLKLSLQIFSIGIPALIILRSAQAALQGLRAMKYSVYVDSAHSLSRFLLILVVLLTGFKLYGVVFAYTGSMVIAMVICYYLLRKRKTLRTKENKLDPYYLKKLLMFSFPLMFAVIMGSIIKWSDTLILGYFTTTKNVGLYNISLPTATIITNVLAGFGPIFLAVITGLYAQKKLQQIRDCYKTTTKWMISLAIPVSFIMMFFAKDILSILFSREFSGGSTALVILSIGFLTEVIFGPLPQTLMALAKTKTIMFNRISITIGNIILNILLIPKFGLIGAAIATAITLFLGNSIMAIQVYKYLKIISLTKNHIKILLITGFSIVLVKTIANLIIIPILSLGTAMILFMFVYIFLFIKLKCLDPEDIELYKSVKRKLGIEKIFR